MATKTGRRAGTVGALLLLALVVGCGGAAGTAGPGASGTGSGSGSGTGTGAETPAGGQTTAPGPASASAPCSLLTDDDIEEATGFRPIRRTPTTAPGEVPIGCEWELDNPGETPWAIVLGLRSPGGRALYDADRASPVGSGQPVANAGDAAVQTEAAVVEGVKGDTFIIVTYMEFPERAEATAALARLALQKL